MSAQEMQQVLERYQARAAELPKLIAEAQWNIVALSGELGRLERQIQAHAPLARAQRRARKQIHLVRPDDPYDLAQTAWYEMLEKAEALSKALSKLNNLRFEYKSTQRGIAYTKSLQERYFGETPAETEGA